METGQVITEKNWNFCAVWTRDRRKVSVSFKYYKEKLRLGVQKFGWWTNSDSLIFNTAKDYSHKWDGQTLEQCAQYTYRAWSNSRWRWKGTRTQNFSLSLLVITRHPRLWCVLFSSIGTRRNKTLLKCSKQNSILSYREVLLQTTKKRILDCILIPFFSVWT